MKDKQIADFLMELKRMLVTLEGVIVKWDDGRNFINLNGKWQLDKDK